MMNNSRHPLLIVENLCIGIRGAPNALLVENVTFTLQKGEIFGITGESGSGKTLTAMAVCGLLSGPVCVLGGKVVFEGRPLDLEKGNFRGVRHGREMMMLFQSPYGALDPAMPVGAQISSALKANDRAVNGRDARRKTTDLMETVGLSKKMYHHYPFQLSGGQRQRVILAMSFGIRPRILFADEPTSGQDDANRNHILGLFDRLRKEEDVSSILISHDIRVFQRLALNMAVMHKGMLVERGATSMIVANPVHPHTRSIVEAMRYMENPLQKAFM